GKLLGCRGICRDVTLRLAQEAKIHQLARIQEVLGALGNAVLRAADLDDLLDAACRLAVEQGHFLAAVIGTRDADGALALRNACGDPGVVGYLGSLGPLSAAVDGPHWARPA